MNKNELAARVAAGAKISHTQATAAIGSMIETTAKALKSGDRVMLLGLGTFSVANRKSRPGRNPQTGKTITIKAAKVVRFKPGTELKKMVNRAKAA